MKVHTDYLWFNTKRRQEIVRDGLLERVDVDDLQIVDRVGQLVPGGDGV